MNFRPNLLLIFLSLFTFLQANSQVVQVGSGSYTTNYPGADEAGRNGFPSGTPQLSGAAVGKPVPTNDWWSKLVQENHAGNLFNYPMTMRTANEGLVVTYIPWGVIGDSAPIVVGLSGLNAGKTTISDYSDWTVTMNWNDGSHQMNVTSGIGMPFLYFEKESDDVLEIKVNGGSARISGEMLIIEDASAGADFVFYAPSGGSWSVSGSTYTSDLSGKNYWSMAMLPQETSDVNSKAAEYQQYAYVFPVNTTTSWSYNEQSGTVTTDFLVETEIKEGDTDKPLIGLLPHQWDNLKTGSPVPTGDSYQTVRGEMKMLVGNSFSVENHFKGILPTMPYLANYSDGFSPAKMDDKINQIANDGLATWTDSYNEGQVMNRLIQTARIADQTGNMVARDKIIATIKERLEDWLTYESGEVAFLFYYNNDWSAMLGYPAGHGQDNNINDHHFHWGYFIHAAAFMEQFEPGWAADWGPMVNHLVRDAATENRTDELYPYLRNFSPYAGHCWANGFASFPQGNDQESTSESMQFNSSLIHWGMITGNDEIRDLGIYLYTTEQTAIEEYWFDVHERNFADNQQYSLVSRVWGNSYDNGTFWTADITASYGIELYPMHGGSLYLAHQKDYIKKLWAEIESNTGILSNQDTNPNLWHDTFWKFLSFMDPQKAIDMYDAYPDRVMKFGVSDAQTYHWLHVMNAMGELRTDVTADYPLAVVFEKDGEKTYVAHNYGNQSLTVNFTDGFALEVPAYQMATNKDADITAELITNFDQAYPGGSVILSATVTEGTATKVEFYDGEELLGTVDAAPFEWKAADLNLGVHGFFAKVYAGENFNVSNIVNVQVGEQVPFQGKIHELPGTIQAAHYDEFQGGIGQNIAYVDLSRNNEGDFRPEQYVDAESAGSEGDVIGWISAGEWVEYTVNVQQAGYYNLEYRSASGNESGGGPFHFEIDGQKISPDYSVASTSGWDKWASKTVSDVKLKKGENVLHLAFDHGEFNLGKLTFSFDRALDYSQPIANAGDNVLVVLPATTAALDGSASADPEGTSLTYSWSQVYGPSTITFSDATNVNPEISNLEEGIYKCLLEVSNGNYSDESEVLVIVSATDNITPSVSITSPASESTYREGQTIPIKTAVSDLDGEVVKVEFYDGDEKIGEDESLPFEMDWANAKTGDHILMAIATDDGGAKDSSQQVLVTVSEVKSCTSEGTKSIQGSFSVGYKTTYETVGNQVKVFFELKDTDKAGVVAFLWKENPFEEFQMDHEGGLTFSRNLGSFAPGETISYACKFAFAGGLAVTDYIKYKVGDDCDVDPAQDATLKNLKVDGVTVSGFNPSVFDYSVTLSEDVTSVPEVTADPNVDGAAVTITPAESIPGTTTISVKSIDQSLTNNYSVEFVYGQQGGDEPTTAAPTPSKPANQVISLFSDAYDDVEVDTWRTGWSEANLQETSVAGNAVKKYSDLNFVGIETIAGQIDINAMQYFHVDVWTPNSTTFRIKLVDFGANASYDGGDDVEHELIFENPQLSQWVSYDIPLSQFDNLTTRSNIAQLIFSSIPAGSSIAYIDNVYFYSEGGSVSSDATLSDLKVDGETMSQFSSSTMTYEMILPAGTVDVPEVTATASHSSATVTINSATSLPGTTEVVVLAEDKSTSLTYKVSFVFDQSSLPLSHHVENVQIWSKDGHFTIAVDQKLIGGRAEIYALSGKRLVETSLILLNTQVKVQSGQVLIIRIFDANEHPVKVFKTFSN